LTLRLKAYARKWLRFYLDFCYKYKKNKLSFESLSGFIDKLASKKQTVEQQKQASWAITRYYELHEEHRVSKTTQGELITVLENTREQSVMTVKEGETRVAETPDKYIACTPWLHEYKKMENSIRLRHYSPKTLEIYSLWVRKFQSFMKSKKPCDLDTEDVKNFLTHLAVDNNVAASTQNQAFNSLLFFYRHVLGREFGKVEGVVRAKRKKFIPVVLSRKEIDAIIENLQYPYSLIITQ